MAIVGEVEVKQDYRNECDQLCDFDDPTPATPLGTHGHAESSHRPIAPRLPQLPHMLETARDVGRPAA
jgi:hypothetical protein